MMMEDQLPPGAVPSDVADDVDIKASEGEYIVPANVVRFIGLDKLEKMVSDATEKLSEMEGAGRVGGEEDLDIEALFDEEGDEGATDASPAFAEGGMVTAEESMFSQADGFAGVKTFKDSGGNKRFIPFFGGQPIVPVPEGFTEASAMETGTAQQKQVMSKASPSSPDPAAAFANVDNDPSKNEGNQDKGLGKKFEEWTVDDFLTFGNKQNTVGDMAAKGVISALPMGAIALKARNSYLDKASASAYDKMIETGLDLQGNQIPQDKIEQLSATRAKMKSEMGDQSGLNLNPIDKLSDAWDKFAGFVSGEKSLPKTQPISVSSKGGNSRPKDSTGISKTYNATPKSDAKGGWSARSSRSVGSDIGKSGPTEGSMASGGLYKEGGLVKKRSKK